MKNYEAVVYEGWGQLISTNYAFSFFLLPFPIFGGGFSLEFALFVRFVRYETKV